MDNMSDLVTRMCLEVGPCVPGSLHRAATAEIIRRELERYLGTKNVVVEDFTFAPATCLERMTRVH